MYTAGLRSLRIAKKQKTDFDAGDHTLYIYTLDVEALGCVTAKQPALRRRRNIGAESNAGRYRDF
jgi:hypothetical protein